MSTQPQVTEAHRRLWTALYNLAHREIFEDYAESSDGPATQLIADSEARAVEAMQKHADIETERATHYRDQWQAERAKVRVLRGACKHVDYLPRIRSALATTEECDRLKFALVEWEAKERGWSKAVEKDAAELIHLCAEVERWKTVAATLSQEREHNANEASRLRAELERLTTKIGNQADRIRYLEGAINHATGTPLSKANARAERAEAEIASMKLCFTGSPHRPPADPA
jgi:chromosome segregation ATPase